MITYYYFQYYASSNKKSKSEKINCDEIDEETNNDVKMSNYAEAVKEDADETVFSPKESEPTADLVDLTNQLVIIFGSFSLGSLEHITKLIF